LHYLKRLPKLLFVVNIIALLSVAGSIFNWSFGYSPDNFLNQGASVVNYLLGPFLLIPLIFSRIEEINDDELLVKGFVFALILPTIVFLALAYNLGHPVASRMNMEYSRFRYAVNIETYQWGNVAFRMIRTQIGIVLAALICASFAVVVSNLSLILRLVAGTCFTIAILLLLITGSVGSSLASLCGIVLILVFGRRFFSIKQYSMIILGVVGFVLITWSILPEGIQRYAESRYIARFSEGNVDTSDRSSIWKNSYKFLLENPLGVGWSLMYIEKKLGYAPHNDYLAYALSYGLFCGILYLSVAAWLLFSLFKISSGDNDPPIALIVALAGVGVVMSLLINSFSDHLTANRWYFNVVWSMVWYAFFVSKRSHQSVLKKRNIKSFK
jgi:O-antigen ligase